jgi:hypothetical protein
MKKFLYQLLLALCCITFNFSWAQDQLNSSQQKRVQNPDFSFDSNGRSVEIIPDQRAHTTKKHNQHQRKSAGIDDSFTSDKLGIVIDHSSGAEMAVTGEITFKLKAGVSSDVVSTLNLPNAVLVMKPDIYVIKTTTPRQLVAIGRQLSKSGIVEWAEPFLIKTSIN